ncbi:MAG: hypothetical protein RL328_522, partial [Acidobacteriota bacterium]
ADGAAPPVRILEGSSNIPMSLSPDGKRLLYLDLTGLGDIWTLPLEATDTDNPKPGRPELFFRTERPIRNAKCSPDGKWIAHSGGQTGTEAFVRPFPGPGGVWQISSGGAGEVYWPRNGQVLFSGPNNGIMQVDYTVANGSFTPGQAREWLRFPPSLQVNNGQDVTPDGKRVIVLGSVDTQSSTTGPTHATFLFNFFDELRRRAPVK